MIKLAKQLSCQKFIFKLHSSRLRKAGWDLTLPLNEARRNGEIISLADSQVLRWIDDIRGITDADNIAKGIKFEIKTLRKAPNSIQVRRQIRRLYDELDEVQFKPDYMCLIMDRERDYRRACRGFKINGITYRRLLGTNGGIKNSTIVFVSDTVYDTLNTRINNGRDPNKELVAAKLEAYKALTCSASIPVRDPDGVIVVNDCETSFLSDIIQIDDEQDGEPIMELIRNAEVDLNESDGYGIMLPSLADKWAEDIGVDYRPSGFNTRYSWEKGMVFCFDYLEFAENVAKKYTVTDAWGVERDVRDAELILTTSMLKLWDSYDSWEAYSRSCHENGYQFGIAKVCPKNLEDKRSLNYQFIQSYQLDDSDIDLLIEHTVNDIRDVLGADYRKTALFLKGVGLGDRDPATIEDDFVKAFLIEPDMINDPYVQSKVYQLIKNRINEAKVGVIDVHGNYSIVSGDPYSLCQSMFGLEVTGILKASEVYNGYWDKSGSDRLACYRAPMSTHENIRLVHVNRSDESRHWYQYMQTCTVFNSWDTAAHALNGCDKQFVACVSNGAVKIW